MAQARPTPHGRIVLVGPLPPPHQLQLHPIITTSSAGPPPHPIPPPPFLPTPTCRPAFMLVRGAPPGLPGPPPPPHALVRAATIAEVEEAKMQVLLQFMEHEGILPSAEDEQKRKEVILQLKKIVLAWIKKVAWQKDLSKDLFASASAAVWTFGSYGLGVHGSESDIDAICVGPYYATLEDDFFGVLHNMLQSRPEVSEIQCVKSAKVPLMRFKFNGVSIDFPYARLGAISVPDVEGFDIDSLHGIDDISLKSLSGVRVNRCILQLVPNVKVFQYALRCIKLWAKRRGVYSHLHGFLGGVHLAILTAYICQRHPEASVTTVISLFFAIYSNWPWPVPVSLQGPFRVAGRAFMPIEMPCGPYDYCNSNITRSTFHKIMEELCRGNEMTAGHCLDVGWLNIFDPFPYAAKYNYFLRIFLAAPTADELHDWLGWVKSRFRSLLLKIEDAQGYCDPNPVEDADHSVTEPNRVFYWGLSDMAGFIKDVNSIKEEFMRCINNDTHKPSDKSHKLDLSIVDSSQLPKSMHLDPSPRKVLRSCHDAVNHNMHGVPVYSPHFAPYVVGLRADAMNAPSAVG